MELSGLSTTINAVQADVAFDPNMLEVVDVDIQDSFASILSSGRWITMPVLCA